MLKDIVVFKIAYKVEVIYNSAPHALSEFFGNWLDGVLKLTHSPVPVKEMTKI